MNRTIKWALGCILGVWVVAIVFNVAMNVAFPPSPQTRAFLASIDDEREVSAGELFDRYRENEIAADRDYKDRRVKITGEVATVGTTFTGPYVTLAVGRGFSQLSAFFDNASKAQLAELRKGEQVAIVCTVQGLMLGDVTASHCIVK